MSVFKALLTALAAVALVGPAFAQSSGPIDPARLASTVKDLTADGLQGRGPGTQGEIRTIDYLVKRLKALKLEPGGPGGSWTQAVPLVHTKLEGPAEVTVAGLGAPWSLRQDQEVYVNTVRPETRLRVASAPMVFVGYGVAAPERGWDDFKGVDLRGKIAVFLVNDPDFEAKPAEPVAGKFGGQAMTYYGRWTYKYEEAARRGAVGALVIHETPGAGYGWNTVIASGGEDYDVVRPAKGPQPVQLQGWLHHDAAVELFRRAGLDFEAQKKAARRSDFRPVAIGDARFSADAKVSVERVRSHNVLAKLTGAKRPGETVMYGAHWDAYGLGPPDAQGRTIRPGANDDALGVAGLLEIARALKAGPKPDRTVVFALWTAEERGLLGSETYAQNPVYPAARVAANFTIDIMQTAGLSKDVVLIGAGQNSLEQDLARVAKAQGRTVTPDAHPERGLFYRADHFSLAKRGVPTLLLMGIGGGPDLVQGGRDAGDRWVADYTAHCYHQTCDAWSPDWNLAGAAQDIDLLYEAGRSIANSNAWPMWSAESEFRAVRDATAAQRK